MYCLASMEDLFNYVCFEIYVNMHLFFEKRNYFYFLEGHIDVMWMHVSPQCCKSFLYVAYFFLPTAILGKR